MSLDQFLAKKKYKEKKIYQSIDNNTRLKLLKIVVDDGVMIRDAADQLNINYSTAKTILRVHRLKKRILRVNKEKKFELFKVVKNDDKPDEVYRTKVKNSSSTIDTVELTKESEETQVPKNNFTEEFIRKVLIQTENAQMLLKSNMIQGKKDLTTPQSNQSTQDSSLNIGLLMFKLGTLLNVYSNLKKEVEDNNKVISNLLNFNLQQNFETLFNFENRSEFGTSISGNPYIFPFRK